MIGRADGHWQRSERENIRPAGNNFSHFVLHGSRVEKEAAPAEPHVVAAMKFVKPSRPESANERCGAFGASRSCGPSRSCLAPLAMHCASQRQPLRRCAPLHFYYFGCSLRTCVQSSTMVCAVPAHVTWITSPRLFFLCAALSPLCAPSRTHVHIHNLALSRFRLRSSFRTTVLRARDTGDGVHTWKRRERPQTASSVASRPKNVVGIIYIYIYRYIYIYIYI